jgi:lipopolysaccharide/colanic/teichoic acid biosynthesis glycosyltransferase
MEEVFKYLNSLKSPGDILISHKNIDHLPDVINYLHHINTSSVKDSISVVKSNLFNRKSYYILLGKFAAQGFDLINYIKHDKFCYWILQKRSEPKLFTEKKYDLIFKQKRRGYKGKFFELYKLRTMYPYSEYLFNLLLNQQGITQNQKINNDPRITLLGAILRRLWLDELPGLINLIKGDMKLVGYRPTSFTFGDLLGEEHNLIRDTYKPGYFPVSYYKKCTSVEKVKEVECQYFENYEKLGFWCDLKYLLVIIFNILSFKIRTN